MVVFLWIIIDRKVAAMKMQKGSFTIEAIIWISLILCIMVGVLQEGISFYGECVKEEISEDVKEWDAVSKFYQLWIIKEVGESLNSEQE
jgi:hypothetical protein